MGVGGERGREREGEQQALCIHTHWGETWVFQRNVCGMRKCAAARAAGKVRVNLISPARENYLLVHHLVLSLTSALCVCVCACLRACVRACVCVCVCVFQVSCHFMGTSHFDGDFSFWWGHKASPQNVNQYNFKVKTCCKIRLQSGLG